MSDSTQTSWRRMLAAKPIRNAAAAAERDASGGLSVAVRTKRPGYLVPPLSWIVPLKPTRQLRLDRVGAQVWDLCDGQRTVEAIVDDFAQRHALSFHEARVAVTSYLSQLVQRGALAVAVDSRQWTVGSEQTGRH